jgi:hypothetical protein
MNTGKFHIPHFLDRIQPSSTAMLMGSAMIVGAGTGLGAVLFIDLIALISSLFVPEKLTVKMFVK